VISRYGWPAGLTYTWPGGFVFSPDGAKLYFHGVQENGAGGLWWLPAGEGEPAQVVAFDDSATHAPGFYSMGADRLYFTIAEDESDIWVMDLEW